MTGIDHRDAACVQFARDERARAHAAAAAAAARDYPSLVLLESDQISKQAKKNNLATFVLERSRLADTHITCGPWPHRSFV